jgi:hypothetical protein
MPRKIFIAVPAYSGEVTVPTMTSLLRARDEARGQGWECTIETRPGDSMVHRGRNVMLTDFLESDASDLVFWDADVAAAPGAFLRLVSHPVDFVGGVYPFRQDPEGYPLRAIGPLIEDAATGLMTNAELGLPAGFLRVTRAGLERMVAAHPELWARERSGRRIVWLFDFALIDHEPFSEDFVFCRRWREAGGVVWLDPDLTLHHTGQKTFSGRYGDFYRRRLAAATTPQELEDAQGALDAFLSPLTPPASAA